MAWVLWLAPRGSLGALLALLGRSWALLGVLGEFLGVLGAFWGALGRSWVDLGSIFHGFGNHFLKIFGIIFEKGDFVKISVSPRQEHVFQGFEQQANLSKLVKNRWEIQVKK